MASGNYNELPAYVSGDCGGEVDNPDQEQPLYEALKRFLRVTYEM